MSPVLRLTNELKRNRLIIFSLICVFGVGGCGDQAPDMDTSKVTSPLHHPGVCEHCQEAIEEVQEENLFVVRGNQHVVCSKNCEYDLQVWLSQQ